MNRLPQRFFALLTCLYFSLVYSPGDARAGVTEWMELRVDDGQMLIETEVDGVAGLSILDTGATVTAINASFLESTGMTFKAGPKVTIKGVHGESSRSTYSKIPGAIFGAPITFLDVVDLELGEPDIQFLLGANFLKNYVFQFDYTNERMRLITRDAVDLKKIKNVESKKSRDSGGIIVRAMLGEDESAWLLMDTGSNGGILVERKLANRLDWIDTYQRVEGLSTGVISSGAMEYFRVPSVGVGPFNIENVLASMPAEGESLEFFERITPSGSRFTRRRAAEGILGYDILKHFVVTVDYDRGYVHFYPGKKETVE